MADAKQFEVGGMSTEAGPIGGQTLAPVQSEEPVQSVATAEPTPEPISEVPVVTTRDAVSDLKTREEGLATIEAAQLPEIEAIEAAETEARGREIEPLPESEKPEVDEAGTFSLEEAQELFGTDFTGLTRTDGGRFTADTSALERLGITGLVDEQKEKLDDDLDQVNTQIEDLANDFLNFNVEQDPEFQAVSQNIKNQFAQARDKMEKINTSRANALRTMGLRRGTTQFAGAIQLGIEGEELANAGNRINAINAQESQALSAARKAFEEGEWTKFSRTMDSLDTLRDNKAEELNNYNEALLKANEKLEEQQRLIDDQVKGHQVRTGILSAINVGMTNPIEILTSLQMLGIEASPEDVTKFTSLIENQDQLSGLSTDFQTYDFLRKNEATAFKEMGIGSYIDYVRAVGDAKRAPTQTPTPGPGVQTDQFGNIVSAGGFPDDNDIAAMSIEERNFVNAVMRQLPTKLKDSENERKDRQKEALFDFRQGRTLQDTIDTFRGLVLETDISDESRDLAMTFRTIVAGTGLDLSEIAAPINAGKPQKAMINAENAALDTVDGELAETTNARKLINNANRVAELLKDAPVDSLGEFDGRKFKVEKFFGLSDEETQATQRLETAMVILLNEIRRASLGTAVTETEIKFLQPMLTDLLDQPELIATKIDELKNGTMRSYNSARAQVGLPEADESSILDNAKRLNLYRSRRDAGLTGIQAQIEEARTSGFSDTEIINVLGSTSDFRQQIEEAIKGGFSDSDILKFLDSSFSGVGSDTQTAVNVASAGKNIVPVSLDGRTANVDQQIATRLAEADKKMFEATGQHIAVNQSFRSSAQQAELFRKSQVGEIGRAAPPGKSFHEKGLAIDVTNWQEAERFLRAVGLINELRDDKGHFSIGEFKALA